MRVRYYRKTVDVTGVAGCGTIPIQEYRLQISDVPKMLNSAYTCPKNITFQIDRCSMCQKESDNYLSFGFDFGLRLAT